MKLRTHLILLTVATVVPVVLFAVLLLVYHARLERSSREHGMRDTARALALALDRDIDDIKAGVEALTASRHLDARGDLSLFYEQAATVAKGFGAWAVLSDPSGRQILNTSRPLGAELPAPTASSLAMMKSVAAGRKVFVSNVFIGAVSQQPAVIVAAPVIRDGAVRYVLAFPFPPTQFTHLLSEAELSPGWIAIITDRDGGVIARVPNGRAFVGRKEGPSWTGQTTSDEGFLQGNVLGDANVYAAYARSKETGWVVAVAAPVELIDAGRRRSMLALSGGGVLLLIVACVLAFVLGKRIAAPIVALAESLQSQPLAAPPATRSSVSEVENLRRALEEARTAEHRAELAQAARAEAEAANRAKDDFLAVLSHELRTPLNATFGWVRLLRSGRLDADASVRALDVIERSVSQQARLISDLLDASRIVFGRLELSRQPVDLPALVAGVVDSVLPSAETQGITLTAALDADAGPVVGDPDRLRQVVENIVGNALKFTPSRGVVTVRLTRAADDARLVVSDTGRGIDPEFLPHIFERFKQSDSTSTRAHAGLGLGLAIVRHLVELHGGQVYARSAGRDKGATFTVVLPIADQIASGGLGAGEQSADGNERLDGVRALVVEDDADTRELITTVLTQAGAVPITATTARDGVSAARRIRPDILVCDVAMPDADGLTVVRQVKSWASETGVPLPALALSGFARSEDRARALAAGFDLYLTKPVEPKELVRAVARLLRPGAS